MLLLVLDNLLSIACFIHQVLSPFTDCLLYLPQPRGALQSNFLPIYLSVSPSLPLEDRKSSCIRMHQNYTERETSISKRQLVLVTDVPLG